MANTLMKAGGNDVASMRNNYDVGSETSNILSQWFIYFATSNTDNTVDMAIFLGETEMASLSDVPWIGRFPGLQNPQDATFSIFQPAQPTE